MDARRRAAPLVCSTADSTAARRSSGRRSSRTSPESSFDSSSRFWASQSSRSICWPLDSRNSSRASGSSAAPSRSSSLNVRRAASGVRSSCETSARKSRLRSRSRRMISTLSSSRSAMALNWTASSAISDEPARTSLAGTRRVRSPSARPRDASVRRRSGVVNRRAMAAETRTLRTEREERDGREEPGDVGQGGRPERVRVGEGDPDRVRREDGAGAVVLGPRGVLLLGLARRRRRLEGDLDRRPLGRARIAATRRRRRTGRR